MSILLCLLQPCTLVTIIALFACVHSLFTPATDTYQNPTGMMPTITVPLHQQKPAEIISAYKRLSVPAIVAIHISKTQIASAYHTLPFDESEA